MGQILNIFSVCFCFLLNITWPFAGLEGLAPDFPLGSAAYSIIAMGDPWGWMNHVPVLGRLPVQRQRSAFLFASFSDV